MLIHEGPFTHNTATSILSIAERKLESYVDELTTRKKIFRIMIEVLQNVATHKSCNTATFQVGQQNNHYIIASGNEMKNAMVAPLNAKLEHINSLDKNELKSLYKTTIVTTNVQSNGGAGLGLIEIARKSGQKLKWALVPINDECSFFSLTVTIAKH
ncbi:MAG TPA: SiaB family protein kinase [Cyclobacteriaceae bacterium]